MEIEYICKFCKKQCKNPNSLRNHERLCKENPNHQESSWIKFNHKRGAWNKGLNKETDERLRKAGQTLSEGYKSGRLINANKGKCHTHIEKQHLSKIRKQYLKEHPDKVPYLMNHHSKGDSYPEIYFKNVFSNANINYNQNYYQNGYFLDFAWPDKKIYIEVDGEQHYVDRRIIEHDKVRTANLVESGWVCVKRIRWSEFQKLDENDKQLFINNLLKLLS